MGPYPTQDAADLLLVVLAQCRSWLDTVEALGSLGGLNFIGLHDMLVVSGESGGRESVVGLALLLTGEDSCRCRMRFMPR